MTLRSELLIDLRQKCRRVVNGSLALLRPNGRWSSERLAIAAFAIYVGVAFPLILFYFGKDEWFVNDDWVLIVGKDLKSIFSPVEHHWTTLPILIYRCFYGLFGANYTPFLATVCALHLSVASLLRVVMRRSGVGAWLATLAAAELVFFAPGYLSITFAIQITQNLSLALGLLQMALAGHDGKIGRADLLALLAGLLNLMSSGLAPVLIMAVGIATLIRRGLRPALLQTVPLGAVFLVWFLSSRDGQGADLLKLPYAESQPFTFALAGMIVTLVALGHSWVGAACIAAVVVAGITMRPFRRTESARVTTAMPLALLICCPIYFGAMGLQRSRLGVGYVAWSHHLYAGACYLLPGLAAGADALMKRWKSVALPFAGALVILMFLNSRRFGADESRNPPWYTSFLQDNRRQLLAIAHSPYANRALHVEPSRNATNPWYSSLTLGWALEQAKRGKLPDPGPMDAKLTEFVELFYGLTDLGSPEPGAVCTQTFDRLLLAPQPGEIIATNGPIVISSARQGHSFARVKFEDAQNSAAGHVLRVELGGLRLEVRPAVPEIPVARCAASTKPLQGNLGPADALRRAFETNPSAMEALKRSIQSDPAAMNAFREAMKHDAAAKEALRRAMAAPSAQ